MLGNFSEKDFFQGVNVFLRFAPIPLQAFCFTVSLGQKDFVDFFISTTP